MVQMSCAVKAILNTACVERQSVVEDDTFPSHFFEVGSLMLHQRRRDRRQKLTSGPVYIVPNQSLGSPSDEVKWQLFVPPIVIH